MKFTLFKNGKLQQLGKLRPGKVVCVGRNYSAHAKELNNPVPEQPLLFIKPASSLCSLQYPVAIPQGLGAVHHECEIALLVGEQIQNTPAEACLEKIRGVGLALDLTLRDLQESLKEKGQPWERAKGFDGACPISFFVASDMLDWHSALQFSLHKNGQLQQQGNSADMLWSFSQLLSEISSVFTLQAGDVVLTGTPAGVSALAKGDELNCVLQQNENVLLSLKTLVMGG